jgi:hypothetical protein
MAKKSSKKQSEQPITANSSNTATVLPTTGTTPPLESPAAPVSSPAPYKPITDDVSIERLVGLAKDSPSDSALGIVWKHAYEEAYQNGRREILQDLRRKLEEKYSEGEKEGIKKGREKYYGKGIVRGEHEEHQRWIAEGHSQHCFTRAVADFEDTEVQTDPATVSSTISARKPPISESPTTYSTSGTQTSDLYAILHSSTDQFIQTNPISAQTSRHTIRPPISSSTSTSVSSSAPTATIGTQTEARTSQHLEINCPAHGAILQSLVLPENRKNPKIGSTSEIRPNIVVFSSPTPSVTSIDSPEPSTAITALEMRPTMANFAQKLEKLEKPTISNQITSKLLSSSLVGPTGDIARVYASQSTPNDVVLQLQSAPATTTTASSSELPAAIGDQKSVLSRAFFESQPPTVSTAPTSIAIALETRPKLVDFEKIHQKVEKSAKFTQNTPESIVSDQSKRADNTSTPPAPTDVATDLKTASETVGFMKKHENIEFSPNFTRKATEPIVSDNSKCADDTYTPPALATIIPDFETRSKKSSFTENDRNVEKSAVSTCFSWADDSEPLHSPSTAPTKHLRDFSSLRSSSPNPFSSLRRRHRNHKNSRHFNNFRSQFNCQHTNSNFCYHIPVRTPYRSSHWQPHLSPLNWDQDPKLVDLSNALQALGWVRR